jgi:hypothetical protein
LGAGAAFAEPSIGMVAGLVLGALLALGLAIRNARRR